MPSTRIDDPTLPNLLDERPNSLFPHSALFSYSRNSKGETVVRTVYSGLVAGHSAGGRRFPTLAEAVASVQAARDVVAADWTRRGWTFTRVN